MEEVYQYLSTLSICNHGFRLRMLITIHCKTSVTVIGVGALLS